MKRKDRVSQNIPGQLKSCKLLDVPAESPEQCFSLQVKLRLPKCPPLKQIRKEGISIEPKEPTPRDVRKTMERVRFFCLCCCRAAAAVIVSSNEAYSEIAISCARKLPCPVGFVSFVSECPVPLCNGRCCLTNVGR